MVGGVNSLSQPLATPLIIYKKCACLGNMVFRFHRQSHRGDVFLAPKSAHYARRPRVSSYREDTKRRNRNACKIGNGESIIAVVYLSRNYKVACPMTSVIARSDQESPLMRRCHSFPARKRYI